MRRWKKGGNNKQIRRNSYSVVCCRFEASSDTKMEKICQNIIENEFRFMTPINYVYFRERKAKFINQKTFLLNMNLLTEFIRQKFASSLLYEKKHAHKERCECVVAKFTINFQNTCIAFVFGNVACNDGTFVGLLIFISKLLS